MSSQVLNPTSSNEENVVTTQPPAAFCGQISGGPAAFLATVMTQMVALYVEIMQQYLDMTTVEAQVQGKSAVVSALAATRAGNDQARATRFDAISAGVSSGLSVATLAASELKNKNSNALADTTNKEIGPLEQSKQTLQAKLAQGADAAARGQAQPSTPTNVQERAQQLEAGKFAEGNQNLDEAAMEHLMTNRPGEAVGAGRARAEKVLEDIQGQLRNKYNKLQTIQLGIQSVQTNCNLGKEVASGAVNAGTSGAKADANADAGKDQASQTIASQAQQSASSATDTGRKKLDDQSNAIAQEISAFRAASQAYPQG